MYIENIDAKVRALLNELEDRKAQRTAEYTARERSISSADDILDNNRWYEEETDSIYEWFFDSMRDLANEAGY